MTDKALILKFAKDIGLGTSIYNEKQYIIEGAVKKGAIESIEFKYKEGQPDLCFEINEEGKLVGVSTSAANSFGEIK